MKYADLQEEVRQKLESSKVVALRYSARVGRGDEFDASILLSNGHQVDVDRLRGFTVEEGPEALAKWFESSTESKDENEAQRFALHALMDVDAAFAEPRIKELEAAA